jgi:hypothetical protein
MKPEGNSALSNISLNFSVNLVGSTPLQLRRHALQIYCGAAHRAIAVPPQTQFPQPRQEQTKAQLHSPASAFHKRLRRRPGVRTQKTRAGEMLVEPKNVRMTIARLRRQKMALIVAKRIPLMLPPGVDDAGARLGKRT